MKSLMFFLRGTLVISLLVITLGCTNSIKGEREGVHHYVYFSRDRERISEKNFLNTPGFEGAQLMYAWKELEKEEGVYDFTEIKRDLDFLNTKGKKLFVVLQDTTFDPQSSAVPEYLRRKPQYHGGVVFQYNDRGKPEGRVAMRWDNKVRERFHLLLAALGKSFDGKIEGLVLQETAIGVKEGGPNSPPAFTYAGYRDAILENMKFLQAAFPRSKSMQYANFMPGEWLPDDDHGYLRSVFTFAIRNGVGIGAPDLMPHKPNQRNHTYRFMHELQGNIPVGIAVQDGNYNGSTGEDTKPTGPWKDIVPELYEFAKSFLKVNYIFWGAQEPYFSHDVVTFLK